MPESIINPVLYIMILAGLVLIFYESFELAVRRIRRHNQLKKTGNSGFSNGKIYTYTEYMLSAVFPQRKIRPVHLFLASFVLFIIVIIFMAPALSYKSVVPGCFAALLPFLFLKFRLENLRNRGSKEADALITGLLNAYRMNHKNIFAAVEVIIKEKNENCTVTAGLLFKLLMTIRNTKNEEYLRKAVSEFAFGIGTNWSYMLSQCIFAAAYEGLDVTESLEDILEQLKTARVLDEEKKRANSESSRLVKFIVPVFYLMSLGMSVRMMDISFGKLMRNQFSDTVGAGLFFLITGLFIVNVLILNTVKNGKFDF